MNKIILSFKYIFLFMMFFFETAHSDENSLLKEQKTFNIDNKQYLFDVSTHTVEEFEALLERIDEIQRLSPETFDKLKIIMVLHGPDIGLFTEDNYIKNKKLVDLAQKLDSIQLVDMKVCETAMGSLGVDSEELPEFIELVPYAPDTIKKLERKGYTHL